MTGAKVIIIGPDNQKVVKDYNPQAPECEVVCAAYRVAREVYKWEPVSVRIRRAS